MHVLTTLADNDLDFDLCPVIFALHTQAGARIRVIRVFVQVSKETGGVP